MKILIKQQIIALWSEDLKYEGYITIDEYIIK